MKRTYTLSARNRETGEMRYADIVAFSTSQVRTLFYADARNIAFRIVAIHEVVGA